MVTKEEAKARFAELIKEHERDLVAGRFNEVSEEKTKDYIDEIFRALGWDIKHDTEKEVLTGRRKRVDYSFHISGFTKFLLEAKAYDVELTNKEVKQALGYAYQNYKKWVVLSNYKEIRIYNCQYYNKSEEIRRLVTPIKISELISRFDDLWLLSRPGCEQNLIEEYAARMSKAKIKEPVDALAEDMLRWREILSKEMREHPKLNEISGKDKEAAKEWIDEAVQMLLNRFVFLRTVEDFGNDKASLRHLTRQWEGSKKHPLMTELSLLFREIGGIYNSGLFEKHQCEDLTLRDDSLLTIINEMYDSREQDLEWDFSVLTKNQDILGLAYEQYLGTVLTETARVKESKKKRKKMGIYYTPKYVVDYIVENTLGELLKKTKNENVVKIKILDPACGSGSFLKQAYRNLSREIGDRGLDKQQYIQGYASEENFTIYDIALKNSIKGVDLDKKAVEMAKLNMLLVGAEKGVHLLPDLDLSIRQGNSLIDDFGIAGKNAFKWEKEFKQIIDEGRFDVVIGNPPYIRTHLLPEEEKKYYDNNFESAFKQYDIYVLFMERGIDLLKNGGRFGFIVSNKFATSDYGLKLREKILNECAIESIVDVSSLPVFKDASVYPYVIILRKEQDPHMRKKTRIKIITGLENENEFIGKKYQTSEIPQERYLKNPEFIFDILPSRIYKIIDKIERNTISLGESAKITRGFRPPPKNLIITKNEYDTLPSDKKYLYHKFITGEELTGRFSIDWSGKYLKYEKDKIAESKQPEVFEQPKIMLRDISLKPEAYFDDESLYCLKTIYIILKKDENHDLRYLIGIINSKAIDFYFRSRFWASHIGGGYLRFRKQFIEQLPIPMANSGPKRTLRDKIIELVDEMIALNKRLGDIGDKKTDERKRIEDDKNAIDAVIDDLVYQLYGIAEEEEKKIIEDSLK